MAHPVHPMGLSYLTADGGIGEINREDLLDIITMISPTDTPLFSSIEKGSASATLHEWATDALTASAADKGHVEGDDPTYPALTVRGRLNNDCQIFVNPFSVSRTQEKVMKAGIQSEVAYQAMKKMEEHKLDIETAIFQNTSGGAGGSEAVARQLKPLSDFISGSGVDGVPSTPDHIQFANQDGSPATDLVLEEYDLNHAMEAVWDAGGKPDTVMTQAKVKRRITGFTDNSTRSIELTNNAERRQINRIDVYEGDFGVVRIVPNRNIATDLGGGAATQCYILETARLRYDFITPPMVEELARTGDAVNRWVYSEGTLVNLAPSAQWLYSPIKNDLV